MMASYQAQDLLSFTLIQNMRTSVIIDKLTNSIEDAVSGKRFDTETVPLEKGDLKSVLKKIRLVV
jgi:hypothetical protein